MSDNIYDKALALYVARISGALSPEDQAVLKQELKQPEFRAAWQAIELEGRAGQLQEFVEQLEPGFELQEFKKRLQQQTSFLSSETPDAEHQAKEPAPLLTPSSDTFYLSGRKRTAHWRTYAAVALCLCLLGGLAYNLLIFPSRKLTDQKEIATMIEQNKAAVQLQLSNGKSIVLKKNDSVKTIAMEESTIQVDKGTMHFTSQNTAMNTLSIPNGENYIIELSDGTEIHLNAGSKLRFPFHFKGGRREVYLEGEAYFMVAKDASHPFIVHTPLTDVQVLGTRFNVQAYPEKHVQTALIEGSVQTSTQAGPSVLLKPGQQADFGDGRGFRLSYFDSSDVLSWMKGIYSFHNLPISELQNMMYRCYGVKVKIKDSVKYKHVAITGIMNKNNLPELLNDLQATAGIHYYYMDKTLYIE